MLVSAGEESIRRAAHPEALCLGHGQYPFGFAELDPQRLLRVHVLARIQNRQIDLAVRRRNGEVEHQVAVVAGQQLLHRTRALEAVCCGRLRCSRWHHIGTGAEFHMREFLQRVQVGVCNHTATDNTYFYFLHFALARQ